MRKHIIIWVIAVLGLSIAIPTIYAKKPPTLQNWMNHQPQLNTNMQGHTDKPSDMNITVPVYLTSNNQVEIIPLEDYVKGVVAAEMPLNFELEALKAQAIAARTYIIRRMMETDYSGVPVKNAIVTDTVAHQSYYSLEQLQKLKSTKKKNDWDKLEQAVLETKNLIIVYDHKPINATFFSTSNGYTENAEDYWGVAVPYLKSVTSPWDKTISPKYKATVKMKYIDFLRKLGIEPSTPVSTGKLGLRVIERSAGNRIKKIQIGNKIYTGKEVREKIGLNSSQFTWKISGSNIEITTTGYGHGVGLSQWGANGMAKLGNKTNEIIKHYYQGVEIVDITQLKMP